MICDIEPARPEGPVFRLGRRPDPWAWPDWAYAGEDGTWGNRFDDSASEYRVLYASSKRLGPFLETLARFRPDPAIVAEQIAGDARDAEFETGPAGLVPSSWLADRALGTARCKGTFADVGHAGSLALPDGIASPSWMLRRSSAGHASLADQEQRIERQLPWWPGSLPPY
jgi:hypothetical protein